MPSLLVLIFVIELAVQVINSIGAATINTLVRSCPSPTKPFSCCGQKLTRIFQVWRIATSLPFPISKQFAEQRTKQKEYLEVRRELTATSSQDQFAKWAKLRRQHDKLFEDLEKKSADHPALGAYSLAPLGKC